MAPLSPQDVELVREALDCTLHNETLEHALGRVLRRRGLSFDKYVELTSQLRGSRGKDEDIVAAARRLTQGP